MKIIDVWINCPDHETARKIGDRLVANRLAACANTFAAIESRYHWKGEIESTEEVPLLVKTRSTLFDAVCAAVSELHPYETPGIVAVPVELVNPDYAAWLCRETADPEAG